MDGKDIGNYCYYIMARSKRGRPDGGEKKNEKNACPVYRISSEFGPGKALREHNTPAAVRLTYGRACIIFRLLNPRDELSVVRRGRFQFQMRVRKIQSPGTTARSPSPDVCIIAASSSASVIRCQSLPSRPFVFPRLYKFYFFFPRTRLFVHIYAVFTRAYGMCGLFPRRNPFEMRISPRPTRTRRSNVSASAHAQTIRNIYGNIVTAESKSQHIHSASHTF